jgi:hypothetical protein
VLSRLEPLASICLTGISYDPFVGRRLWLLYRLQPASEGVPLAVQLKRLRPVTVSALLATWLRDRAQPFTEDEAVDAVRQQLAELPRVLFAEPRLRDDTTGATRAALAGLVRLGMLRTEGLAYRLGDRRTHPQFPRTADMIAHQANFHEETLEGARFGA